MKQINLKPIIIQCRDSNSLPLEHESPPKTNQAVVTFFSARHLCLDTKWMLVCQIAHV